jgi:hypothetical protein
MNKTLHTPGPWKHTPSREHSNPDTTRRDIVAESQFGPAFIAGDVSQSDANLIAFAPDLLLALETLLSDRSCPSFLTLDEWHNTHLDFRSTLRKAKGEA